MPICPPGEYARLVTCFAETAVQSHSNGPAMALGKGQMGNVGLPSRGGPRRQKSVNSALWLITMHARDGSNGEGPLCSPVDCPRTRRKIDAHR